MRRFVLLLLAAGLIVTAAGCKQVNFGSGHATSPGGTHVYIGLTPPVTAGAPTGTWVRQPVHGIPAIKGHWVFINLALAAAAAAAGGMALASKAITDEARGSVMDAAWQNNPCQFRDHRHQIEGRPAGYKLGWWQNRVRQAYLDCGAFNQITGKHLPSSIQRMFGCLQVIFAKGQLVPSTIAGAFQFAYKGGAVVVDKATGRILTASPADGGWGKCARA